MRRCSSNDELGGGLCAASPNDEICSVCQVIPATKYAGAFCPSDSLFMGNTAIQEGVDSARSQLLFTSTGAGSTQHLS